MLNNTMRLPKKKLQNKKKIVVFSLARSDFGILKGLIFELKKKLNLSLVVSGAHHSKIFGKTISEINNEKLKFKKIYVDYEKSDTGKIFNKIIVNMYNFLRKEKFDYIIHRCRSANSQPKASGLIQPQFRPTELRALYQDGPSC